MTITPTSTVDIDNVYDYFDQERAKENWQRTFSLLFCYLQHNIHHIPKDLIFAWANASAPYKDKIEWRDVFVYKSKQMYPNEETWKGL